MIRKIISSGREGVEQAALDVAIKIDIPYDGWIPKGRNTEDSVLPEKYRLKQTPIAGDSNHIEKNILDSDGTLIISHGKLSEDSALVEKIAEKHSRHRLHVDLNTTNDFFAAQIISMWIAEKGIQILNISGPESSKDPKIYRATAKILETVLYLDLMGFSMGAADQVLKRTPRTVDDAADVLIAKLSLRDKAIVANMNQEDLASIHFSLGEFIKRNFELGEGHTDLMESCCSLSGKNSLQEDEAVSVIIGEVWKKLRETHRLRLVK